jgi:hypothetical protein
MEPVVFFESVDKSVRAQLEKLFKLLNSVLSGREIEIEFHDELAYFSHISVEYNLVIHMILDRGGYDHAEDGLRVTVEKLFNDSESAIFLFLTDAHDLFRILSPSLIDGLDDVHDSNTNLKIQLPFSGEKPPANFDEIWKELSYQVNESLKFIVQRELLDMATPYKEHNNESSVLIFQDFPYRVFINCLQMESGYLQYALSYGHLFKRSRMNLEAWFSLSQTESAFKLIPDKVLQALQYTLHDDVYRQKDNEDEDDDEDE